MPNLTLDDAVRLAAERHQAGRLIEARHLYEQVLRFDPRHGDGLNLLGVLLTQVGEFDEAEALFRRAVVARPGVGTYWNNLGGLLRERGQLEAAADAFRTASTCDGGLAEAFANLGQVGRTLGRAAEAVDSFATALRFDVAPEARTRLLIDHGLALRDAGRVDEALQSLQAALSITPDHALALQHLTHALGEAGRIAESVAVAERASAAKRTSYTTLVTLGVNLIDQGRVDDGLIALRRALEVAPEQAGLYLKLCHALQVQGRPEPAERTIGRLLDLAPTFGPGHRVMADIHFLTGRLDDSIASLGRAIELDPSGADHAHGARCFTRQFHVGQSPAEQLADLRAWDQRFAAPLASRRRPHGNDRDPDRRLRVGYLSPNFTNHCQSFFMSPLLAGHDPAAVEVYCYSDVEKPHPITKNLQRLVPHWRQTHGMSHAAVAEQVRNDKIDVLVDLTMHMSSTRLLAMAEKPAPVQVTWLAYPGSTGVSAIDYRLTDPYLDPPGMFEQFYAERTVRLPDTFWVYNPLDENPPVNASPCGAAGPVTFGSFNNFAKVNEPLLRLWARVLAAVPRSRFALLTQAGRHRTWVLDVMTDAGVDADRVEFFGRAHRGDYLLYYHRVDVTLDTVPYNGHTTSLDSFWMGVPVVTLVGSTVVGRAGLSQMTNLGLTELVAYDEDQFVRIAVELAQDRPRMAELRRTLRDRLRASPLMDGPRFARGMEAAFRHMWRDWCAGRPGQTHSQ
jgi:protein O-GlcNAc transferase